VGELSGNTDTYWSVNMYKQRNDDKFYFGPVWDFDIAFENDNRTYPVCGWNGTSDWIFRRGSWAGNIRDLVNHLLTDAELYKEIQTTYSNYRDWGNVTEEKLIALVDYYADLMDASQKMNFKRWKILNQRVHQNNQPAGSYEGEVNVVKKYLKDRIVWMDKKLNYVPNTNNKPPVDISTPEFASVKLWTGSNAIHIESIIEVASVEVVNYMGQKVKSERQKTGHNLTITVPPGIYIVRLLTQNGENKTIKCRVFK
jgi:hypothetical protein